MKYECEWLEKNANNPNPTTCPCEWVKNNWGKSASQVDKPYPCESLKTIFENGDEPINPNL